MNTLVEQAFQTLSHRPDWLLKKGEESLSALRSLGVPTRKDEEWKYTSAKRMIDKPYALASNLEEAASLGTFYHADEKCLRLVFHNGRFVPSQSNIKDAPSGLEIKSLNDAWSEAEFVNKLKSVSEFRNAFQAANTALLNEGLVISAKRNQAIASIVDLVFIYSDQGQDEELLSSPTIFVDAEPSSALTVRELHVGDRQRPLLNNIQIHVTAQANSRVKLYKFQNLGSNSVHVDHTEVEQMRDSRFETFSFTLGASLARNDLQVKLKEPGASVQLDGLYATRGNQHVDNQTVVDHISPNCESSQLYKGVLKDKSRAVFNGKVLIRRDAQQTNAQQLNKNLLLSEGVEVDTKPQMEIDADDVKCAHGATVGRMADDELFYLESRGIRQDLARKMLAIGFLNETIQGITDEFVRQEFELTLKKEFTDGI